MATRALTRAPGAALALLALLVLAPAVTGDAAQERKVWRALTDGEPRGAPPAAARPSRPGAGAKGEAFPSQLALALIVAALLAAIFAVGAHQARRRTAVPPALPPPEAREPEPEAGSHVEELWREHLRRRRPPGDDTV